MRVTYEAEVPVGNRVKVVKGEVELSEQYKDSVCIIYERCRADVWRKWQSVPCVDIQMTKIECDGRDILKELSRRML